jgi:biopolymer transport protein ExbD
MKFPRNTRILQGRFDVAPYAGVFFLMVGFLILAALVPTAGLPLQLPMADGLPGKSGPTVSVAVDRTGRFYFQNQMVNESELERGLRSAIKKSREPLTLVVQADKAVSCDNLVRLTMLAQSVGIHDALLATLPRVWDTSP